MLNVPVALDRSETALHRLEMEGCQLREALELGVRPMDQGLIAARLCYINNCILSPSSDLKGSHAPLPMAMYQRPKIRKQNSSNDVTNRQFEEDTFAVPSSTRQARRPRESIEKVTALKDELKAVMRQIGQSQEELDLSKVRMEQLTRKIQTVILEGDASPQTTSDQRRDDTDLSGSDGHISGANLQTYLREVILKDLFVASEKLRRKGRCTVAQRKLTDAMQLIEDSAKLISVEARRPEFMTRGGGGTADRLDLMSESAFSWTDNGGSLFEVTAPTINPTRQPKSQPQAAHDDPYDPIS